MKKITLALVAPLEKTGFTGGQARAGRILTEALDQRPELTLHNVVHPHREEARGRNQALRLRLRFYRDFFVTLIRARPDLVHFFAPCSFYSILEKTLMALLARLFGARVILNLRNDPRGLFASQPRWRRRALAWMFRRYHGLLCQFERLRDFYTDSAGVDGRRVHVVHNSIPIREPAPDSHGFPQRFAAGRLIFLGSVSPRKGIDVLLNALAQDPDRRFHLDVVGDPQPAAYGEQLHRLSKQLGLAEQVMFHGPRFGVQKDALLDGASCLVLPSRAEGFPNVVLEAAQFGLPSVLTRTGAAEDIQQALGEGVELVDVGDPAQLMRAIQAIFDDPDRYRSRALAAHDGAAGFSVPAMTEGFVRAYQALARRP